MEYLMGIFTNEMMMLVGIMVKWLIPGCMILKSGLFITIFR